MTTPEEIGNAITAQLKDGLAAVAHAQELAAELVAVKAMLTARNAFIDERTKAHAEEIAGLKAGHADLLAEIRKAHADREAELQQDLREARLNAKDAQSRLDVMIGKWQQLGLASNEVVGRPTPRVVQKAQGAVADALASELGAVEKKDAA